MQMQTQARNTKSQGNRNPEIEQASASFVSSTEHKAEVEYKCDLKLVFYVIKLFLFECDRALCDGEARMCSLPRVCVWMV